MPVARSTAAGVVHRLSEQGQTYLTGTYESGAEAASSSVRHLTAALHSASRQGAAGHPGSTDTGGTPRITAHRTGDDGRHHTDPASDIPKEEP